MSTPPGPNYFSDPLPAEPVDTGDKRRGMVNHVRIVAWLNLAEAGLELCLAVMCLFAALLAFLLPKEFERQGAMNVNFAIGTYLVLGGVQLVLGILRLAAALQNYQFRGRMVGIISFCVGLIASFAGCCAPTAIGVAIYGLIVLFDGAVAEAFEMRATGASVDEVLSTFDKRPP